MLDIPDNNYLRGTGFKSLRYEVEIMSTGYQALLCSKLSI